MRSKFKQSWELFKASIAVTLQNRKLLWFPALTSALTGLIALFFLAPLVVPVVLHPTGYHLNQMEHWVALKNYYLPDRAGQGKQLHSASSSQAPARLPGRRAAADASGKPAVAHLSPLVSVYLVLIYFISMFLATFFNVAFYNEIIAALNGREVSLRRGLSVARRRLPSILAWTLLAGAVGWVLRAIERRLPLGGRITTGLIGMAWSVAAVFAIPVIIQERPMRNPIKILQQSALTLKRTWGEGVIGYLGFSAGSLAIFAGSLVLLLMAGVFALLLKSVWFFAMAGVLWVLGLLFMAYLSSVAGQVYRCALYIYGFFRIFPVFFNRSF